MTIIRSEVSRRFATARSCPSNTDPVTGGCWVPGLYDADQEEQVGRRALFAQELFDEYGPPNAPQLPLNREEMSRLAKTGDFGLAVASFAHSLELNGWNTQRHPIFEEYMAGLLSLPTMRLAYGAFRDVDKLCCWYGAHPLRGLHANGVWYPPVH